VKPEAAVVHQGEVVAVIGLIVTVHEPNGQSQPSSSTVSSCSV
jgi:hypothetical protein